MCTYPKKKNSKDISHFRSISLLNVKGKIFFAILASSFIRYFLINGYIDTSVQKVGVCRTVGCSEFGNMIWEAIQKANKKDLDVIWLDLANAYESVPYQMYHIPEEISKMQGTYLDCFLMPFTTKYYTINWNRLEVGLAMECSVSPIFFVLPIQLLLKAAQKNADIVELGGGFQMPEVITFMDDTIILSSYNLLLARFSILTSEQMIWDRNEM